MRFSPVNNDYIAWIYDDENFGAGAIVLVGRWTLRDYDTLDVVGNRALRGAYPYRDGSTEILEMAFISVG